MKTIHKKHVLAAAIVTLLSACDDDDYKATDDGINTAPVHGGNIVKTVHEKDEFSFAHLLGATTGDQTGEGIVTDADGDILSIQNITADTDDLTGFEIGANKIGIRTEAIAPLLDTGDIKTVVFSFDIYDGTTTTPRTLTVNVTGEDAAPVAEEALVGNFTKDAGTASLDLLSGVFDADGEALTASNVVADSANPFDLPVSIVENQLQIDVASVQSQIPDGNKVTFNFTYKVNDHRFEIDRNLSINILGVKDVAGAPLVSNYFKSAELAETASVLEIDLADDVVEREGDAIVVSEVMVDGEALPYGYSLAGTVLTIDPHAFFNDAPADGSVVHNVTYKVADDQGNMSDGVPELAVTITGEQTNILALGAMTNPDFENVDLAGDVVDGVNLAGFSRFGWATWWCATPTIGTDYARTGSYGLRFEGRYCDLIMDNVIENLPSDQKYAFSYGLLNKLASDNEGSNPYVPIFASTLPEGSDLDNRYWSGPRYFDTATDKWMEHVQIVSTLEGGNWDGYEGSSLSWDLMKYADVDGQHHIDDLSVVAYGHYDVVAHDMLEANAGTFDDAELVTSSGGTVEVQTSDDGNKLFVDTSGAESDVTISLPVKMGAIKPAGRFAVVVDAQLTNHDELYAADSETEVNFYVNLSNGTEFIAASLDGKTVGPAMSVSDFIISEDFGRTADVNWASETMVLNIILPEANAQYLIDNVRLIAIP